MSWAVFFAFAFLACSFDFHSLAASFKRWQSLRDRSDRVLQAGLGDLPLSRQLLWFSWTFWFWGASWLGWMVKWECLNNVLPFHYMYNIYKFCMAHFPFWLVWRTCQILRDSSLPLDILLLTTMNRSTWPTLDYMCPAEGCTETMKSNAAVTQHVNKCHREMQHFNSVFDFCTVLSFIWLTFQASRLKQNSSDPPKLRDHELWWTGPLQPFMYFNQSFPMYMLQPLSLTLHVLQLLSLTLHVL